MTSPAEVASDLVAVLELSADAKDCRDDDDGLGGARKPLTTPWPLLEQAPPADNGTTTWLNSQMLSSACSHFAALFDDELASSSPARNLASSVPQWSRRSCWMSGGAGKAAAAISVSTLVLGVVEATPPSLVRAVSLVFMSLCGTGAG